mgnify:CR=1 FL=1
MFTCNVFPNFAILSHCGRRILCGDEDREKDFVCIDAETGQVQKRFRNDAAKGKLYVARLSPNGKTIVSDTQHGEILLWEVSSGEKLTSIANTGELAKIAPCYPVFSPDSNSVALLSKVGLVIYDLASGTRQKFLLPNCRSVDYSMDGKIVVAYDGTKIAIISVGMGKVVHTAQIGSQSSIIKAKFSSNGKNIAACSATGELSLCGVDGVVLRNLKADRFFCAWCSFSHDGRLLVTGGAEGKAKVWIVDTGELMQTISLRKRINTVEFSQNDKNIFIGIELT